MFTVKRFHLGSLCLQSLSAIQKQITENMIYFAYRKRTVLLLDQQRNLPESSYRFRWKDLTKQFSRAFQAKIQAYLRLSDNARILDFGGGGKGKREPRPFDRETTKRRDDREAKRQNNTFFII